MRSIELRCAIAHRESRDSTMCNCTLGFASRPGMTSRGASSIINHDRPDLDRTGLGAGDPRGDGKRGVEVLGFDQVVAAKLFARLRERTVRGHDLVVADP